MRKTSLEAYLRHVAGDGELWGGRYFVDAGYTRDFYVFHQALLNDAWRRKI